MLDLFGFSNDPAVNLLPCDGEVHYYGKLMTPKQANDYYTELMSNIAWENDQAIIFGKRIITKRKVAWYGDQPFQYTYSKITKEALTWTPAEAAQGHGREGKRRILQLLPLESLPYRRRGNGLAQRWRKGSQKKWRHCITQFWRRKKICIQT